MKLIPIILLPPAILIISMFLPYIEHQYEPGVKIIENGWDFPFAFIPISVMLLIIAVATMKPSRFTSIIAFVLCFGLLFSLFLMQFFMRPSVGDFTLHTYRFGYVLAFLSALAMMSILLINLVKTFRNTSE